jgi:hypothetical protein
MDSMMKISAGCWNGGRDWAMRHQIITFFPKPTKLSLSETGRIDRRTLSALAILITQTFQKFYILSLHLPGVGPSLRWMRTLFCSGFPSLQEYLDGEVPALESDDVVTTRLAQHGWAFVLDVASVGKTTLALRMATGMEQREHPTFYIDLAV